MNVNQYAGWTLVLGTILLLVTLGRIDLLLILLSLRSCWPSQLDVRGTTNPG
jgi:hypothetical protein